MIEHAAMVWLVNAVWVVPLVALGAALATGFGRLGPRGRHGLWLAALLLALVLPALPRLSLAQAGRPGPAAVASPLAPAPPGAVAERNALPSRPPAGRPPFAFDEATTRAALALACLAAFLGSARLARAATAARRLGRRARPAQLDAELGRILRQFAQRRRLALPPVLESGEIASPAVVGMVRPAILIPIGFTALPADQQRAALLHELAHVARRDYGWNLACEAASLPGAWHPAMAYIRQHVRRSREGACDAWAAEAMSSRLTYAKCLVALAERLGPSGSDSTALVGLIGKRDLEERVMNLLSNRPTRAVSALRLAGAGALVAAVLAPAVLLRVSPAFAQARPATSSRAPPSARAPTPGATASPAKPAPPVHAATAARAMADPAAPAMASPHAQRFAQAEPMPPMPPTPPDPPMPPDPPPPPPPPPPAPPAPPPPPPPPAAEALRTVVDGRHWEDVVRRASDGAAAAREVMSSPEMRRAMAELAASRHRLGEAERARIHAEIAAASARIASAHVQEAMNAVRAELDSPAFRESLREATRQAAREAAQGAAEGAREAARQAARAAEEAQREAARDRSEDESAAPPR